MVFWFFIAQDFPRNLKNGKGLNSLTVNVRVK